MSSLGLCAYKDEVTELKDELNNGENQRNPVKYKQLIQQVILYMTKGIDMTPLFMTIVKAAATKDLVQKKLCYLYLCHYSSSNADLALLTVNTLKRDAEDTNYMIRGLALRSVGSLRIPSLVEYTKDVMLKGLQDHSSYVKKAAVIGCLQLYKLAPHEIGLDELVKELNKRLTKDHDMQVRRNSMYALEEMFVSNYPSKLNSFLLKRLDRFDEWGLQFAMDVLMRYRPEKKEDIFSSLNCLDVCLKHANTSVVLGAIQVFLHYTSGLTELRDDVFNRIKVPLLTALSSKSPEISYSVVCHVEVILHQAPALFEDSISSFYCRYSDPVYLKIKKLDVLAKLVTESNGKQILDELSYYAQRSETASHSIQNIGTMALLHPPVADICVEKLFYFLQSRNDSIVSHALAALRDLVIKYDKYSALIPGVSKYLKLDILPDGKASVVWMLGEFGESIPEAPYVLEAVIDDIDKEASAAVKLELLTASAKLLFKRPPECQAMLGHLLEHCIEQEHNMDIRDRALMYYRLLEFDVNKAKEVICCPRSAQFIDSANIVNIDSKDLLLNEFNTLSVVYGKPSLEFATRDSFDRGKGRTKTSTHEHKRGEKTEKHDVNDSKEIEQEKNKKDPVIVDTSLVEIDQEPSLLNDDIDSPEKHLSSARENTLADKDSPNQAVFGNEPLLPTDEDANRLESNTDMQDKSILRDDDNLDEKNDNIHSVSIPNNDSTVILKENSISLDGDYGEAGESSDLEGHEMTMEGRFSLSQMFVEEPDLSHEMFESLWMQLPETESYEIELDEIPDQNDFLKSLASQRIYTMASTPPGAEQMRYFLYAQSDCYILCEVSLDSATMNLRSVIKMEGAANNVHDFIEVFQNCLTDIATS